MERKKETTTLATPVGVREHRVSSKALKPALSGWQILLLTGLAWTELYPLGTLAGEHSMYCYNER